MTHQIKKLLETHLKQIDNLVFNGAFDYMTSLQKTALTVFEKDIANLLQTLTAYEPETGIEEDQAEVKYRKLFFPFSKLVKEIKESGLLYIAQEKMSMVDILKQSLDLTADTVELKQQYGIFKETTLIEQVGRIEQFAWALQHHIDLYTDEACNIKLSANDLAILNYIHKQMDKVVEDAKTLRWGAFTEVMTSLSKSWDQATGIIESYPSA